MIKLPTGGTASLTHDLSYFPRLNGVEETEKLVKDFEKFIAPMLISPLINSCHSQLTLDVHSSVPLPASDDGVTWKCQGFSMTLFPSQLENCSKYAEEEAHHHYVCKVSMESKSAVSVEVHDKQNENAELEEEGAVSKCNNDNQHLLKMIHDLEKRITDLEVLNQSKQSRKEDPKKDAMRLAEIILPEDVWYVILEKVKDPQDRFSCYNTCKLFKRILGISAVFDLSFPNLFLHLEKTDVLNLRKVSRNWKRAVDYHLKHHESLRPPTPTTLSRCPDNKAFFKKWLEFNGSTYILNVSYTDVDADPDERVTERQVRFFWRRWMELMALKSPLLTGLLHLSIPGGMIRTWMLGPEEEPLCDLRWEKVFDVIGKLGPHILYLKLTICEHSCYPVSGSRIYHLAQVALTNCPNLRKIIFEFLAYGEKKFSTEAISAMPLPDHRNLEAIEVVTEPYLENSNEHGLYPLFFAELIFEKYCKQLGKVTLNTFYDGLRPCDFPRVSHFRVKTNGTTMLKALTAYNMLNLKKLSLYYAPGDECPLKSILEVLNAFPTMSNLKIEVEKDDYRLRKLGLYLQELGNLPLQLSAPAGIEILEFCHSKQVSYNFICCFPGIRVFSISQRGKYLRTPKKLELEFVDLHEILRHMHMPNSNVWSIVPSLQEIAYRVNSKNKMLKWSRP